MFEAFPAALAATVLIAITWFGVREVVRRYRLSNTADTALPTGDTARLLLVLGTREHLTELDADYDRWSDTAKNAEVEGYVSGGIDMADMAYFSLTPRGATALRLLSNRNTGVVSQS